MLGEPNGCFFPGLFAAEDFLCAAAAGAAIDDGDEDEDGGGDDGEFVGEVHGDE